MSPGHPGCGQWCGREDSNFHGLSATATSTLRVYQFRHDRTCMRMDGLEPSLLVRECASIKAIPTAQWWLCDPGSGQCLTPCLPLAGRDVRWACDSPLTRRRHGHRSRRCRGSAGRRYARGPGDCNGADRVGSARYRQRASERSCGSGGAGNRPRRRPATGPARRISLKNQPFRLSVTVESSPLAGTSICALLKVALAPGSRVRVGGVMVQL